MQSDIRGWRRPGSLSDNNSWLCLQARRWREYHFHCICTWWSCSIWENTCLISCKIHCRPPWQRLSRTCMTPDCPTSHRHLLQRCQWNSWQWSCINLPKHSCWGRTFLWNSSYLVRTDRIGSLRGRTKYSSENLLHPVLQCPLNNRWEVGLEFSPTKRN